ncbi:MAG: ATP-dependent zinc metalloprotease FtsH [Patescibacteria group bacterium]|nr:ATP-dependent zinc metalloprotease FtsH [Patescibacteria group bacterium]
MAKTKKNNRKPNSAIIKQIIIFVIVFLVLAVIFSLANLNQTTNDQISLSDFIQLVEQDQINKIDIQENVLTLTLQDESQRILYKETDESLGDVFKNYQVAPEKIRSIQIEVKEKTGLEFWLVALLPFLLPLILIFAILYFMSRQVRKNNVQAMMFGKSKTERFEFKGQKITFEDVAGIKEAKEELEEIVSFLKTPKKFTDLGARIPKGVLLLGHPGCGKTLLARAVAGEAGVPFFNISGSEFVEMFVGVGASRVRDLFNKAKKNAPAIVFVDELDAVGRHRGAGLGGSHDEREQTLNQILVEMDGFEKDTNVIVMAATNRPDVLDPALLRPGRFDRRVVLNLPDIKDRIDILAIHAKNKPLAEEVDLKEVAERTPGFSGADLANLLNEAAILTAKAGRKKILKQDIFDSIEKVMLGPERKSHILLPEEKKITAYHEAGHALVSHLLPHADPVQKVSIVSRGMAAGYTLTMPETDKSLKTRSEFVEELSVLLAGYATEKEILHELTTGATNDLSRATQLARNLVTQYGMSENLGPQTFGKKEEMIFLGKEIHEQRDYSEKIAEKIDQEVSQLIQTSYQTAKDLILKNKNILEAIVKQLLIKETLEKKEFAQFFLS